MKKIIYIPVTCCALGASAQIPYFEFPCVNEVSTDPDNTSNSSLPVTTVSNPDLRFINGFDWVDGGLRNHDIFHFFTNKVKI